MEFLKFIRIKVVQSLFSLNVEFLSKLKLSFEVCSNISRIIFFYFTSLYIIVSYKYKEYLVHEFTFYFRTGFIAFFRGPIPCHYERTLRPHRIALIYAEALETIRHRIRRVWISIAVVGRCTWLVPSRHPDAPVCSYPCWSSC